VPAEDANRILSASFAGLKLTGCKGRINAFVSLMTAKYMYGIYLDSVYPVIFDTGRASYLPSKVNFGWKA
jgi:hypothetical protein